MATTSYQPAANTKNGSNSVVFTNTELKFVAKVADTYIKQYIFLNISIKRIRKCPFIPFKFDLLLFTLLQ